MFSWKIESPARGDLVEPALLVLYGLPGGAQEPNDGVVPVDACVWGEFLGCIAAIIGTKLKRRTERPI